MTSLVLGGVNVSGLNSFSQLQLLQIVGDYTVRNAVELRRVNIR